MSEKVVGIGIVGDAKRRARPMSLVSPGHQRSTAVLPVAGSTVVRRQLDELRRNGVREVYLVANGRENRCQTVSALSDGRCSDVQVRYLRSRFDDATTGSAHATLAGVAHWGLTGTALVFPTDTLFRLDLATMLRTHHQRGAAVTVATRRRRAHEVLGTFGLTVVDGSSRVVRFVVEMTWSAREAMSPGPTAPPPISTGIYLVETDVLRELEQDLDVASMATTRLDWALDLLPWMVRHDVPVSAHPVHEIADVATPHGFLCALPQILGGALGPVVGRGEGYVDLGDQRWVHESTLALRDTVSGRSLAEKLDDGLVRIRPQVRLGRDVEVRPGVSLCTADVDDGTDLGVHADLRRVVCGMGTIVGESAALTDCHLGAMVEIASDAARPTRVGGFSALGDGTRVPAGAHLLGVHAYPGTRVPGDVRSPTGSVIRAG